MWNKWKTRSAAWFRVLTRTWLVERNDVRMTWPKGNYRGYPPPPPNGYTFSSMEKSPGASGRLGQGSGLIKWNGAERSLSCFALSPWNTEGWWIRRTSRLVGCCPLKCSARLCFGWMLYHHGQAKEVAEGIYRVAQVRCHRPAIAPRRGSMVDPRGVSPTYAQNNPLSPLSPNIWPQVIREWEWLWHFMLTAEQHS